MVVVNVNPLYTPRELEHQLKDSGAKADRRAGELRRHASAGDGRGAHEEGHRRLDGRHARPDQGALVNHVVRNVKKMVPAWRIPECSVRFKDALAIGAAQDLHAEPKVGPDDIAVLQYTGGTTGVSKGAVLLHRNLVANMLQAEAWYQPALKKIPPGEQFVTVCALPLYHIFGFNTNMMLGMRMGGCNMLIANPRDIPAVLKELSQHKVFHSFPAVNTLFNSRWPTTPTSTRSTGAT
jgi:long-chain acyl-CoA synthetase